jgi:hypothetical protein
MLDLNLLQEMKEDKDWEGFDETELLEILDFVDEED